MTREEFNKKYYIEATVISYQRAELSEDNPYGELDYGPMEEVLETVEYIVMSQEHHDNVMVYEGAEEDMFFEELKEKFNIVD